MQSLYLILFIQIDKTVEKVISIGMARN